MDDVVNNASHRLTATAIDAASIESDVALNETAAAVSTAAADSAGPAAVAV